MSSHGSSNIPRAYQSRPKRSDTTGSIHLSCSGQYQRLGVSLYWRLGWSFQSLARHYACFEGFEPEKEKVNAGTSCNFLDRNTYGYIVNCEQRPAIPPAIKRAPTDMEFLSSASVALAKRDLADSNAQNLIADSGTILMTFNPLPTKKPRIPPCA